MVLFQWLLVSAEVPACHTFRAFVVIIWEIGLVDSACHCGKNRSVGFLMGKVMWKAVVI